MIIPAADLAPSHRPYQPFGRALDLLHYKGPEVLLSGPAGTGKSRACLEKLHLCAEKYDGMRGLIIRKTRESLTEAALVTFESHVLPAGHAALETGGQRRVRQAYAYPNGSTIVVGGLDKSQKVMSTEYDLIYVQEAIEVTETDWEALTTRLRNGVMPYQQLMADTNPDAPSHWLKKRCDVGRVRLVESRHEDNPTIWDHRLGQWTPRGEDYISKLNALTGPRFHRLRHGRWVQAEGVVFDGWDASVHIVDSFPIPASWTRYLSVDFGFTNPFVAQWWAEDPDGRLFRYREIYHTRRLVEDHARQIREVSKDDPIPSAVVADTDAEDRATLEKHLGWGTFPATKTVSDGLQAVASRLRKADDGKARIFFLRDSLVERDPVLLEAKKPCCTEEEFDGYIWDVSNNRKKGEEPVKLNDHGMDATRYLVMHVDKGLGKWAFSAAPPSESPLYAMPGDVFETERAELGGW